MAIRESQAHQERRLRGKENECQDIRCMVVERKFKKAFSRPRLCGRLRHEAFGDGRKAVLDSCERITTASVGV